MLSKRYRLRKKGDFERLSKFGKKFYTKEIGLKYIKNNLQISRFGVVVSLKISKKAVVRNKLKRRILDIIKKNIDFIKPG
ncbi:ribonuclease P protein component, partial [bacterium]|nr:ribonuclease P protein component [bacterium]